MCSSTFCNLPVTNGGCEQDDSNNREKKGKSDRRKISIKIIIYIYIYINWLYYIEMKSVKSSFILLWPAGYRDNQNIRTLGIQCQ